MDTPTTHVMTIANSIIGVSILAMPYCFKQCGIFLSILMLILSSIISRLACHFLLKSAIKARLKTFEFLAYHAFGPFGKFIIEIGMIGFLLGTCIAFFVVMGDLGPQIVSRMVDLKMTSTVRTSVLVILAVFCILPLGLLRNVDSLSGVCTATIGFYMCLVLKIMGESAPHILLGDWYDKVEFWRTEGALQCIPIFSMALFCQTQLFEIYQAIPNASLERMNSLIRIAVNICTSVYIFVGIFGYIALANESFSGNVLMSFRPSFMTEIMKVGFVLSVAFSFPLIIFPCRASLFSLLYKPTYVLHDSGANYIPEGKFRLLTVVIVSVSLVIGVLIPNIELVLGLVGSTIGVMICVLFPATCFICMSTKNTNERILAQIMLFIGIIVMVLGTYANIYAIEEANLNVITEKVNVVPLNVDANIMKAIEEHKVPVLDMPSPVPEVAEKNLNKNVEVLEDQLMLKEVRHEPPQPVEPEEVVPEKPKEIELPQRLEPEEVIPEKPKEIEPPQPEVAPEKLKEIAKLMLESSNLEGQSVKKVIKLNLGGQLEEEKEKLKSLDADTQKPSNKTAPLPNSEASQKKETAEINRSEQVDIEAIKKEDKEIIQQQKEKDSDYDKNLELRVQISQLQKQNQEQQQLVQKQKKILEEIKQRQEALMSEQGQNEIDKVKEEKLKAVKEIETIAKQAIKSLVEDRSLENEVNAKPALANLNSKTLTDDSNDKEAPVTKTNLTDTAKKPSNDNQKQQLPANQSNVPLLVQNGSFQQDKVIKLEDLIPIPIAKSNNISVFASMNLSNNYSMKPNALNDENKLESKFMETLASKVSPEKPLSEPNKNEEKTQSVTKSSASETAQVDAKQKDETSGKLEEKHQAMRRDILSEELQRLKRDTKEICNKSDVAFQEEKLEASLNQPSGNDKSDSLKSEGKEAFISNPDLPDAIRRSSSKKTDSLDKQSEKGQDEICEKTHSAELDSLKNERKEAFNSNLDLPDANQRGSSKKLDSLDQQNEKERGEICEKTHSEELGSFKSEGKETFNLNVHLINADLARNILDSGFNTFKNRKK